MLNEGDIKAAVIDKLFASDALENAVLINEMVVANWSRRADLVVANGKLHAFEIKSDLDTLRRLGGQVETYLQRFDKVTVVCTAKFAHLIKDCTDSRVEIWCATSTDRGVKLSVFRRGQSSLVSNKRILCGYLHKAELITLLKRDGRNVSAEMPRIQLECEADALSVRQIRNFVLHSLKERYKSTFEQFCTSRQSQTYPKDLARLSKFKNQFPEDDTSGEEIFLASPENAAQLDLLALSAKFGPLPLDMPTYVRRRE